MDNVEKGLATAIKSPVDVSSEESSVEVPARTRSRSDAGTEHDQSGGEWSISESRTAKDYESHKLGLWQAVAINTLNMFGTGPFITIPYLFSATNPAGPQVKPDRGHQPRSCP